MSFSYSDSVKLQNSGSPTHTTEWSIAQSGLFSEHVVTIELRKKSTVDELLNKSSTVVVDNDDKVSILVQDNGFSCFFIQSPADIFMIIQKHSSDGLSFCILIRSKVDQLIICFLINTTLKNETEKHEKLEELIHYHFRFISEFCFRGAIAFIKEFFINFLISFVSLEFLRFLCFLLSLSFHFYFAFCWN